MSTGRKKPLRAVSRDRIVMRSEAEHETSKTNAVADKTSAVSGNRVSAFAEARFSRDHPMSHSAQRGSTERGSRRVSTLFQGLSPFGCPGGGSGSVGP